MSTIRCPHCGTANRVGSNFCNRCGTDLRTGDATVIASPEEAEPPSSPASEGSESVASPQLSPIPLDMTVEDALEHAKLFASSSDEEPLAAEMFTAEPPADSPEEEPPLATAGRLILGVQGLLEPVRISNEMDEADNGTMPPRRLLPTIDVALDQLRRLRGVMTQDPTLLNAPPLASGRYWPALRLPWLFVLLGCMVGLPLFLGVRLPVGEVHPWPGVTEAYRAIQNLAPRAPVLVVWGYDPATADEMDLVALPLLAHLLDRQSQPIFVSVLPNGPATARRLWERVKADLLENSETRFAAARVQPVDGGFLPGGATVLPLLAQDLRTSLLGQRLIVSPTLATTLTQPLALTVVVAATAEDVQQWLELGQPVQHTPLVAFTSAGADPALRPYLESGQLRGLVSGFDGADVYQQLRERPLSMLETEVYRLQRTLQNWGHLAFLLLIVLGNLAALLWARS